MASPAAAAARRAALRAPPTCARSPPDRRRQVGSAGWRPDPQPVTVRVAKFELTPIGRLARGPAELGYDRLHIAHEQVDQGVRPGIAPVLGKKQPRSPTSDRYERGHAGLEAMLPLLCETQALIPADCLMALATRSTGTTSSSMGAWSHTSWAWPASRGP